MVSGPPAFMSPYIEIMAVLFIIVFVIWLAWDCAKNDKQDFEGE